MKKAKGSKTKKEQPSPGESEALKNTGELKEDKTTRKNSPGEEFPGYPHYPANEDLLNPANNMERLDIDVERITRAGNISGPASTPAVPPVNDMQQPATSDTDEDDELGIVPGTEADVTKEDLVLLGERDQDMDLGDDEELQNKGIFLSSAGGDLDVPGEELDDANEDIGEEDEENNYYSLGGDEKDSLEEDKAGG